MVRVVTSFSRGGLRDWLLQRVTAVILGVYAVVLIVHFLQYQPMDFETWGRLFQYAWIKIFSVLALLSVLVHAWIGMWIVYTDYVKPTFLRLVIQILTIITLFAIVAWGVMTIWG